MSAAFSLPRDLPHPRRDCVFTTALLVRGRAAHWARHRARLEQSCRELYGEHLPGDLDAQVDRAAGSSAEPRRLTVRVGPAGGSGLCVRLETAPAPARPRAAVHLATVSGRTGVWHHKWCDRSLLDTAQDVVGPDRVPLFLDDEGGVLETSRANVVVTDGAMLRLAPATSSALPGVTVQVLRDRAQQAGMTVVEAPLTVSELAGPLVATCSSIAGVVAVRAVDGRVLHPDEGLRVRLGVLLEPETER